MGDQLQKLEHIYQQSPINSSQSSVQKTASVNTEKSSVPIIGKGFVSYLQLHLTEEVPNSSQVSSFIKADKLKIRVEIQNDILKFKIDKHVRITHKSKP